MLEDRWATRRPSTQIFPASIHRWFHAIIRRRSNPRPPRWGWEWTQWGWWSARRLGTLETPEDLGQKMADDMFVPHWNDVMWWYVMLFHVVLICLDLSLSSLIFALCCLKGHRTLIRSILVSLGQAAQSCIIGIEWLNESHHVFSSWSWCGFVVPNLKWLFAISIVWAKLRLRTSVSFYTAFHCPSLPMPCEVWKPMNRRILKARIPRKIGAQMWNICGTDWTEEQWRACWWSLYRPTPLLLYALWMKSLLVFLPLFCNTFTAYHSLLLRQGSTNTNSNTDRLRLTLTLTLRHWR